MDVKVSYTAEVCSKNSCKQCSYLRSLTRDSRLQDGRKSDYNTSEMVIYASPQESDEMSRTSGRLIAVGGRRRVATLSLISAPARLFGLRRLKLPRCPDRGPWGLLPE